MESNQQVEAFARVVQSAGPAQEYCFLWIDWWATCMTKAEWSGWMQAIGSVAAILCAVGVAAWQLRAEARRNRKVVLALFRPFAGALIALPLKLPKDGSRSLWDIRLTRLLLEGELRRFESIPLHALVGKEEMGFMAMRLGALQALEALKIVESAVEKSDTDLLVSVEAYKFLQSTIENCKQATEEGLTHFKEKF